MKQGPGILTVTALDEVREKVQHVRCRAGQASLNDGRLALLGCNVRDTSVHLQLTHRWKKLPFTSLRDTLPEELVESRCPGSKEACRLVYNHNGLQHLDLRIGAHGASVTCTLPCATSVANKDACLKKGVLTAMIFM